MTTSIYDLKLFKIVRSVEPDGTKVTKMVFECGHHQVGFYHLDASASSKGGNKDDCESN